MIKGIKMNLDNNLYDNNQVFNKNEELIFKGNFKELKEFMMENYHLELTDNEDMEVYEEFKNRDFKIQCGIAIEEEFFKELEAWTKNVTKLENFYDKIFSQYTIKEMLELIKSKEVLAFKEQYKNEGFIVDNDETFIDEIQAQTYHKYKESGIKISFPPTVDLDFKEFMFTTDLFAIQEDEDYYIFEQISGQGETFYGIYNIIGSRIPTNTWHEIIEYSKELNILNKTYEERINEAN